MAVPASLIQTFTVSEFTCAPSDAPPQARGLDGSIPQPGQFVIQDEERERRAGHLEARDVVAHQAAADRQPLCGEPLVDLVVEQVELDLGRAAQAVDER